MPPTCPVPSPLVLALMGAPGSGKGTMNKFISSFFSLPPISTGDLIRKEIKSRTSLGKQIESASNRGEFVPDDVVGGMLLNRIQQQDCKAGFILDGYPRRVSQAKQLNLILSNYFSASSSLSSAVTSAVPPRPSTLSPAPHLHLVVNFELSDDILVKKITARRVCPTCGNNYNVANIKEGDIVMPPLLPKRDGYCDRKECEGEKGKLIQRKDDEEGIVKERLKLYWKETYPLLNFYEQEGNLMRFPVKKGVQDVPDLLKKMEDRLGKLKGK